MQVASLKEEISEIEVQKQEGLYDDNFFDDQFALNPIWQIYPERQIQKPSFKLS